MAENLLVALERDPDEGYTPDARVRRQLQRKLGKKVAGFCKDVREGVDRFIDKGYGSSKTYILESDIPNELKKGLIQELRGLQYKLSSESTEEYIEDLIGSFGDEMNKLKRVKKQEGGTLLVPPEQEGIPEDTFTPEDQVNAEDSQLPDEEMESNFVDFILDESLEPEEQDYLMGALEADPRLSEIFDKVVDTASEFTGEGEVEGPGTGVSDSIPARLSDGEFVMTQKATDQIGSENLQSLMDEAERAYEGGLQRMEYAFGGEVDSDEEGLLEKDEDEEIKKQMITANRMPSVI